MATIKSFTDISQSKKLAEILPVDSADMRYAPFGDTHPWVWDEEVKLLERGSIPCWSLSALLNILPDESDNDHFLTLQKEKNEYCCCYEDINGDSFTHVFAVNPIDACVEMIIRLNELNLL